MVKMIGNLIHFISVSGFIASVKVIGQRFENRIKGLMPSAGKEMRRATRLDANFSVAYRVKGTGAKWNFTISKDYSSTGIRMILLSPLQSGTEIEMNIRLPEAEHSIRMHGVVVWVAQTSHQYAEHRVIECGVVFDQVQQSTNREKLIYLIADKLSQLGLKATRHLVTAPVATLEELKACYRIVYQSYFARGYCSSHPSQMYYTHYSFLPRSRTFTLKDKDKLLGTISLIVDSPCGLPMDNLFSSQVDQLRAQGRKLAEVGLLAMAHGDNKKKIFSLTNFEKQLQLFRLFKIMYEYAYHVAGVTDLIIMVHPKHEILYKYLMFRTMGSPKNYSETKDDVVLPLHLDIRSAMVNCSSCLRDFFMGEVTPAHILGGGLVPNAEMVRKFLCEEQALWSKMPLKAQDYFNQCYPGNVFDILELRKSDVRS